jgi:hypothetical protein
MGDARSSRKGFWKTRRLLKDRLIEGNRGSGELGDATRADCVYPMTYKPLVPEDAVLYVRFYGEAAPKRDFPDFDLARCQAQSGISTIVQV